VSICIWYTSHIAMNSGCLTKFGPARQGQGPERRLEQ
jgi:hypothetical protein